ncbi:hypothetical protein JCM1841_001268 [Sporobolomyces salmonicolor]
MPVPFEALIPFGLLTVMFAVTGTGFSALKRAVNDGKPVRHTLDTWEENMMERDRRLTGSLRGQSAKPVNVGASVLVRRSSQPLLYSNEAIFDKDSAANSRKEAAAHIRRAKLRAAKKAKRAHAEVLSQELVKRAVSSIEDPEGLTKRGIERRALFARALKRVRCGQSDSVCAAAVTSPSDLPTNGAAVCSPTTHQCVVGCVDGYVYSGGQCIASATTCGTNTCGTVDNGVYLCSSDNVCTLVCDSSNGYTAGPSGTCVATSSDPDNCGSVGNVCPASYNGIGTPSCSSGACRIVCPAGYSLRKAQSTTNPYYCYNGSSSLVSS